MTSDRSVLLVGCLAAAGFFTSTVMAMTVYGQAASGVVNSVDLRAVGRFPVALSGLYWFASVLVIQVWSRRTPRAQQNAMDYTFALAAPAGAWALYCGYKQVLVLKMVSWPSWGTFLAVVGILWLSAGPGTSLKGMWRRALGDLLGLPRAVSAALAAGACASIWGGCLLGTRMERATEMASAIPPQVDMRTQAGLERFHLWYGARRTPSNDSEVTVVEFNDYTCGGCKAAFDATRDALAVYEARHPGKIRFMRKDYPLDGECNQDLRGPGGHQTRPEHSLACEAAAVVRLARRHDRASQMEEWLFARRLLSAEDLWRAAREVGRLAEEEVMRYKDVIPEVEADVDLARRYGINGTPTFLVNGVRVGGPSSPYFTGAIDYELRHMRAHGANPGETGCGVSAQTEECS